VGGIIVPPPPPELLAPPHPVSRVAPSTAAAIRNVVRADITLRIHVAPEKLDSFSLPISLGARTRKTKLRTVIYGLERILS